MTVQKGGIGFGWKFIVGSAVDRLITSVNNIFATLLSFYRLNRKRDQVRHTHFAAQSWPERDTLVVLGDGELFTRKLSASVFH